jgi:ubiquinone/menaquinone biosynthesis C-methylase UbiE
MPAELAKALADYRALAARYDHNTRRINAIRLRAIDALELRPGEMVLDVGCGTGFCFAPILQRIGRGGRLIAFDPSSDLLAVARSRVEAAGWRNVTLLQANAESVALDDARPRALLFSYVHDILQSDAALDHLLALAAPGARVAITGTRLWPRSWWPLAPLVNAYLWKTHERYITNREENFDRPWAKLAPRLNDFRVQAFWPGWRYVARGRVVVRAVDRE